MESNVKYDSNAKSPVLTSTSGIAAANTINNVYKNIEAANTREKDQRLYWVKK